MGLKVKLVRDTNQVEIKLDGKVIGIIKVDPVSEFRTAKIEVEFIKEYEIRRVKFKELPIKSA